MKNHTFIHPESGNSLPLPKPPVKKKPVKKRPYHELPKKICVECGWSGINLSTHMKREHHNEIYRYLSRCIKEYNPYTMEWNQSLFEIAFES